MHSARALGTPAVVIYTGYTSPNETGYEQFENLRSAKANESCWQRVKCEHCLESASDVSVHAVLEAVYRKLDSIKSKPIAVGT